MTGTAGAAENFIKTANVDGQFYSDDAEELTKDIKHYLAQVKVKPGEGSVRMIIVPHAGYMYSAPVAAHSFKAVSEQNPRTVIILAPTHYFRFKGVSVWPRGGFETPLGTIAVDEEIAGKLIASDDNIRFSREVYEKEHAVEVEIPFIQTMFPQVKIVPMIMGREFEPLMADQMAAALDKVIGERDDVLIVISTDMSHYHDDATARKLDQAAADAIMQMDNDLIVKQNNQTMEIDGEFPVMTAIAYARRLGLRAQFLNYGNSGDITGDRSRVVGYLAIAFVKEDSQKTQGSVATSGKLNDQQKQTLLWLARQTVDSYVTKKQVSDFQITDTRLKAEEGAFVTLHKNGVLRGCIGHIIGSGPLAETVRGMAVAAASQDPRFPPVTAEELDQIDVEVSVLSKPRVVKNVNDIVMGEHGVIVSRGGRMGVFLPQVADETGWSRDEFLSQLCSQKAGLPADCWKDSQTKIEIFTAQVFGEKDGL